MPGCRCRKKQVPDRLANTYQQSVAYSSAVSPRHPNKILPSTLACTRSTCPWLKGTVSEENMFSCGNRKMQIIDTLTDTYQRSVAYATTVRPQTPSKIITTQCSTKESTYQRSIGSFSSIKKPTNTKQPNMNYEYSGYYDSSSDLNYDYSAYCDSPSGQYLDSGSGSEGYYSMKSSYNSTMVASDNDYYGPRSTNKLL